MKYEDFSKLLNSIRKTDEELEKFSELNIDLENTDLIDYVYETQRILFIEVYGEEGFEWIFWYLYEWPSFQKQIEENGPNKDYYAWDENGNPMDLSTDEKLWEMLEKEYVIGKKYHDSKRKY